MYYKEVGTIYLAHLKKDFFALTQPFFPNNFNLCIAEQIEM